MRTRTERRNALLAGYRPLPGVHDELVGPDGQIRPHWEPFLSEWCALSPDELTQRFGLADRHVHDTGVSYRVHGDIDPRDPTAGERAWPLSHVPLVITGAEWQTIAAGVAQRADLLSRLLDDIYGPGEMIANGLLPASVVTGSPDYLRPLQGAPGGGALQLYAADLGRGPDGRWWVLQDRTQAPSGAGYALENRLALSRAFPDMFRTMNIERLAAFFQGFRAGLVARSKRVEPRICLLTPGPLNESYFEQTYLARYLGFLLVEGGDLVMREGRVHVRTIAGLKRADVIWRRIDGDFADPLELNASSALGVAGLVQAVRKGSVHIANGLGSGVVEARALMSFLPALGEKILGEEMILPNVATWWCGQPRERADVLSRLDEMSIAPAFRSAGGGLDTGPVVAADLSAEQREALRARVEARGMDYVGQEVVRLSTTPVFQNGRLQPRPMTLRVFAAATPDGWKVMPGGFCRISDEPDARAVSLRSGVRSSDVWVTSDGPVDHVTLLPTPDRIPIRRITGTLPSRAADNLFWLGRYLERTEATLRLVRALLGRLIDTDPTQGRNETLRRLAHLLVSWGASPGGRGQTPASQASAALHALDQYGSAISTTREARRTASVIRERLSVDAWRLFGDMQQQLTLGEGRKPSEGEAYETADRALKSLAAFSGLSQENMVRGPGWRFLDIGRRLERGIATCRFARHFAETTAPSDALDALLDLTDSQITYRSRYLLGASLQPVLDLVMLDPFNPRSVAFQIDRLDTEIRDLPSLTEDGMLEAPRRLILKLAAECRTAEASRLDRTSILLFEQLLMGVSSAIADRYFLQNSGPEGSRLTGIA
ncbi:circularly permuted type 2 ATP-grasp protein [Bosea sp. (in: a-proteobacteria)]|uniref:circularly permuted type 2 ATP-grasp protein n=1 Tax=Bosea sp. (in: a-proteobacteria) TaxID=1871050 RepID=UPI0027363F43|nr:circularly permuted type 2 ATP-grasp protein [Bosea sp. (in: a-proteobacteria)]MDP3407039.1 circularly permuted type 2 ATP-grasp protein [Bosea sp. (in: a-proteobacteria)]